MNQPLKTKNSGPMDKAIKEENDNPTGENSQVPNLHPAAEPCDKQATSPGCNPPLTESQQRSAPVPCDAPDKKGSIKKSRRGYFRVRHQINVIPKTLTLPCKVKRHSNHRKNRYHRDKLVLSCKNQPMNQPLKTKNSGPMDKAIKPCDKQATSPGCNPPLTDSQQMSAPVPCDAPDKKEEKPYQTYSLRWKWKGETFTEHNRGETVEDWLKKSSEFRKIAEKNKNKELVIVRDGKPISTHFPCSLVKKTPLTIRYIKAADKTKQPARDSAHRQRKGPSDELVVFHVWTSGGKNIVHIMKNPTLKTDFDEITVFTYKDEKVKHTLKRDGRFQDVVFTKTCALLNKNTEEITSMHSLFNDLDGKHFKIILLNKSNPPDSQESLEDAYMMQKEPQISDCDENPDPSKWSTITESMNDNIPPKLDGNMASDKKSHEIPNFKETMHQLSSQLIDFVKSKKPQRSKLSRIQISFCVKSEIPNLEEMMHQLSSQLKDFVKSEKPQQSKLSRIQNFFRVKSEIPNFKETMHQLSSQLKDFVKSKKPQQSKLSRIQISFCVKSEIPNFKETMHQLSSQLIDFVKSKKPQRSKLSRIQISFCVKSEIPNLEEMMHQLSSQLKDFVKSEKPQQSKLSRIQNFFHVESEIPNFKETMHQLSSQLKDFVKSEKPQQSKLSRIQNFFRVKSEIPNFKETMHQLSSQLKDFVKSKKPQQSKLSRIQISFCVKSEIPNFKETMHQLSSQLKDFVKSKKPQQSKLSRIQNFFRVKSEIPNLEEMMHQLSSQLKDFMKSKKPQESKLSRIQISFCVKSEIPNLEEMMHQLSSQLKDFVKSEKPQQSKLSRIQNFFRVKSEIPNFKETMHQLSSQLKDFVKSKKPQQSKLSRIQISFCVKSEIPNFKETMHQLSSQLIDFVKSKKPQRSKLSRIQISFCVKSEIPNLEEMMHQLSSQLKDFVKSEKPQQSKLSRIQNFFHVESEIPNFKETMHQLSSQLKDFVKSEKPQQSKLSRIQNFFRVKSEIPNFKETMHQLSSQLKDFVKSKKPQQSKLSRIQISFCVKSEIPNFKETMHQLSSQLKDFVKSKKPQQSKLSRIQNFFRVKSEIPNLEEMMHQLSSQLKDFMKSKKPQESKLSRIQISFCVKSEIPNLEETMHQLSSQLKDFMKSKKPQESKLSRNQNISHVEFGKNAQTCREVKTMKKLMALSDSVCQVRVNDKPVGSGFLLFGRYVLTNAHVVKDIYNESKGQLNETVTVHFSFESLNQAAPGAAVKEVAGFEFGPDVSGHMYDWALLRLAADQKLPGALLKHYGFLPQSGAICIIGHPDGGVKKIDPCLIVSTENRTHVVERHYYENPEGVSPENSHYSENRGHIQLVTNQFFEDVAKNVNFNRQALTYESCFYFGSSGSPVFDEHCNVIAVHSGGYPYRNVRGERQSVIEYGHPLSLIIEHIIVQMVEKGRFDVLKEYLACNYARHPNTMSSLKKLVESRNLTAFKTAVNNLPSTSDESLKTFFEFFSQAEAPVPMEIY